MTLTDKTYLKWLFLSLAVILVASLLYASFFIRHYPLPITGRISFDAKLRFIRERIDRGSVHTLIVGSSIGLNNVQGMVLEEHCEQCRNVLNLSVYEASALEVEQVLELRDLFPHLERVVYSAQFPDFAVPARFEAYHPNLIRKYLDNGFTPTGYARFLFELCQNIFYCIRRQWDYLRKHSRNNQFGYLGFDRTGSVPLHIYGDDIIRSRWEQPHWTKQSPENYRALERIAKTLHNKNIRFYFVVQPYRRALIERYPQIRSTLNSFVEKSGAILSREKGYLLDLNEILVLDDSHYADRSHLNEKGSRVATEVIAEFIRKSEAK